MNTYGRQPVAFERGEGPWLWDTDGKRYLDALCGIGVTGLGHAHPKVSAAICDQASTLMHTSNIYQIDLQSQLADRLCALSGMDNAFFCNSGLEANEAALKLARLYGHSRGIDEPAVIVMENSFHGRSLAMISASGSRKVQAGFEPLVKGFVRVPFDDIEAIGNVTRNLHNVVAVMVEPVQGEGGVRVPSPDYLRQLREICDQNGWLLMLDEVQTGTGRTGKLFAFQHSGILPDVLMVAKGLGNGLPIGACLASGPAAGLFKPGNHGTTFGGNPLACRTGLTVLQTIEEENLMARAVALGARITDAIRAAGRGSVRQVRNHGLMIGVELDRPCGELVALAIAEGLLINVTAERVVRMLPPLILSDEEADELVARLLRTIDRFDAATDTAA